MWIISTRINWQGMSYGNSHLLLFSCQVCPMDWNLRKN
jgi:hypothetical protein